MCMDVFPRLKVVKLVLPWEILMKIVADIEKQHLLEDELSSEILHFISILDQNRLNPFGFARS